MKKILPWLIIVALAGFFIADHFNSKADLAEIEHNYIQEKQISETTIKFLNEALLKKDEHIAELNGSIDSLNTVLLNIEAERDEALVEVAEARKGWEAFSLDCQAKLKELDSGWAKAFGLSQQEIANLKEQVRLADERDLYRQGQIIDFQNIIVEKDRIIQGCEGTQKDLAKALIRERGASRLKTWISAGLFAVGFVVGRA